MQENKRNAPRPPDGPTEPGGRRAERLLALIAPIYPRVVEETARRLKIDPDGAVEAVHKVLEGLLETASRRARKKRVENWDRFLVEASVRAYRRSLGRGGRIVLMSELTPEEDEISNRKPSSGPNPLDAAIEREEETIAWSELRKLPTQQRRVIALRSGGLAFGEIARGLGTSPGAARFHYHVGVRALRRRLHVAA